VGGWRHISVVTLALALAGSVACGQHSAAPGVGSETLVRSVDKFPRLRTAVPENDVLPSTAVVPFGTRLPAGTLLTIRLMEPLSSANAHADQPFAGVLDEDVTLEGQTLLERGTTVRGRVVECASKRFNRGPGYLRLTLTEISIDGQAKPVRTYSSFLKGAGSARRSVVNSFPGEHLVADTAVLDRAAQAGESPYADEPDVIVFPKVAKAADVQLGVDRKLIFHLLEPLSVSIR
jgi:hypothetical protein